MNSPPRNGRGAFDALEQVAVMRTLVALGRAGVLDSLIDGPTPVDDLAARHGLVQAALRRALDLLEADGWVVEEHGRWRANRDLGAQKGALPEQLAVYAERLDQLEDYLRCGTPAPRFGGGTDYATTVAGLHDLFAASADELARRVPFDIDTVLDLGTGSGVFGIAMAKQHGADRLVGFDRPEVVQVFDEFTTQAGLDDVAVGRPGDFFDGQLPTGFDCVLICNVLRVLPVGQAKDLLLRAADCLTDDGHLVIVDVIGEDPPPLRRRRAMYRLDLALRCGSGGPHAEDDLERWLNAAGLSIVDDIHLDSAPLGERALIAER